MTVQTKLSLLSCVCASMLAVAIPLISIATAANEELNQITEVIPLDAIPDEENNDQIPFLPQQMNSDESFDPGSVSVENAVTPQSTGNIPEDNPSTVHREKDSTAPAYICPATVSVLNTKTGKITDMPLETYIVGVVSAEMPYTFNIEALKAQAVAARSYCLYQIEHGTKHDGGANVCTSYAHCAAYISEDDLIAKYGKTQAEKIQKKVKEAVDATSGQILTYEGKPALALFHSRSYGTTEAAENVWGGKLPYLTSVDTPETDYISQVTVSEKQLTELLTKNGTAIPASVGLTESELTLSPNDNGRVDLLYYNGYQLKGKTVRSLLKLKSCDFTVEKEGDSYVFDVHGYGHGVGMSQYGANAMANEGNDYRSILLHYYQGVSISA